MPHEEDRIDPSNVGREYTPRSAICGITCYCGPNGEPLACGYRAGHTGPHAWASLQTAVLTDPRVQVPPRRESEGL